MCDVTFGVLAHGRPGDSLSSERAPLHRHKQHGRERPRLFLLSAPPAAAEHWKPNRPGTGRMGRGRRLLPRYGGGGHRDIPARPDSATARRSAAVSAGPEILTVRSGSRLLCALIVHTAISTTPPGTRLEHVVEMHTDIR